MLDAGNTMWQWQARHVAFINSSQLGVLSLMLRTSTTPAGDQQSNGGRGPQGQTVEVAVSHVPAPSHLGSRLDRGDRENEAAQGRKNCVVWFFSSTYF